MLTNHFGGGFPVQSIAIFNPHLQEAQLSVWFEGKPRERQPLVWSPYVSQQESGPDKWFRLSFWVEPESTTQPYFMWHQRLVPT